MVSEPTTTIHGGLERHIKYGSLINLTCEIQSYPGQLQYVVWYRNHQSLMKNPRYDIRYIQGTLGKSKIKFSEPYDMTSLI